MKNNNCPSEKKHSHFMPWMNFLSWVDFATEEEIDEAVRTNRLSYMQKIYINDLKCLDSKDRVKFLYERRLPKNIEELEGDNDYIIQL